MVRSAFGRGCVKTRSSRGRAQSRPSRTAQDRRSASREGFDDPGNCTSAEFSHKLGPVLTLSVCCRALSPVAAKGCPGGARRATEAVGAARRCPAPLWCRRSGPWPGAYSLRSLRSLRSDRMRQKCPRGALRARAMNPALRSASHARRAPPGQPFAGTRAGTRRAPPPWLERQAVPGGVAVCGAEQRSLRGRRAQRAFVN